MMKVSKFKGGFLIALFLILAQSLSADNFVINNDKILSSQVSAELETIGAELKSKTGVGLYVAVFESLYKNAENMAPNNLKEQDINQALNKKAGELTSNFSQPYILLILVQKEHKIKIFNSKGADTLFDKEQVLSPMPNSGTIIPILVSKKGKDIYNAAVLNGYADIADQVASSQNVKLASSIGNANKNVLNGIRFIFYGTLILVVGAFVFRKFKGKK